MQLPLRSDIPPGHRSGLTQHGGKSLRGLFGDGQREQIARRPPASVVRRNPRPWQAQKARAAAALAWLIARGLSGSGAEPGQWVSIWWASSSRACRRLSGRRPLA
jgi:hypothetical protein